MFSCTLCESAGDIQLFADLQAYANHMMRFHDNLMRKRGFIGALTTDELVGELLIRFIEHPEVAKAALRAFYNAPSPPLPENES